MLKGVGAPTASLFVAVSAVFDFCTLFLSTRAGATSTIPS